MLGAAIVLMLSGLSSCETGVIRKNVAGAEQPAQKGSIVTVLGSLASKDQAIFEQAMLPFEEETGIDVVYESTDTFVSLIESRMATDKLPDVVMISQPGLMADYAESGLLVPLTRFLDIRALRTAYSDDWIDLGSVDEVPYALWYRASVKSLVWYRPTAFEAKGYDIPSTWPDMIALSDRIVAEGGTPWCIGLESGEATGWPATDWVEDILLRTAGPEAYSQWIDHRLLFDTPPVLQAFDEFGRFLRSPQYVQGGATQSVTLSYEKATTGILTDPPECYMHRQGSFAASFFPEEKAARVDYDVFPLPGIDTRFGMPILVAGDAIALFHDTPESRAFMAYIASPTPHEIAAGLGGFI